MRSFTLALLSMPLIPAAAAAATVTVFTDLPGSYTVLGSQGGAKYRLSHTNWDMSLSGAGGTFAGNFVSQNLGNVGQLNNLPMVFTLENAGGEGVIYSLSGGSYNRRLAWGTFVEDPCGSYAKGQCVSTKTINGKTAPSDYNAIHLAMSASRFVSGKSGSSMAFTDFSVLGLTLTGAPMLSGSVGRSSSGKAAGSLNAQEAGRWLVSNTNLASIDWKFSAKVTGFRDAAASSDELVRMVADFKQVSVPEPGPALYMATAAAFFGTGQWLKRRRTQGPRG